VVCPFAGSGPFGLHGKNGMAAGTGRRGIRDRHAAPGSVRGSPAGRQTQPAANSAGECDTRL